MNPKFILFFVTLLAACLTQFASDIYAPSLISIASALQTPLEYVQWSMAIYMLGVALSQLIYGPISEGIGRQIPIAVGLSIMLCGSLLCLFATNIELLILGRFIQGCGAGGAAALWRSIFRDVFSGEELAKFGSYMVIFIMFIVPAAPVLGGYLEEYFSWKASFVFMSGYTFLALAAVIFFFKETSQHHHKSRLHLSYIRDTYLTLLKSPIFMGITMCTFLSYGSFFSWFVVGPVIFMDQMKLSPIEYGWISFFGGGLGYVAAGLLNGRLVGKFGISNMLRFGWSMTFISGLCLFGSEYFLIQQSLELIVFSLFLFYFGSTFIWPNAVATAFTPYGKIAGYVGSLYGFMQISGGAIIGWLMSLLTEASPFTLSIMIIICSTLSWVIYEGTIHYNKKLSSA